jgi:hypothetical protein
VGKKEGGQGIEEREEEEARGAEGSLQEVASVAKRKQEVASAIGPAQDTQVAPCPCEEDKGDLQKTP